MVSTALDMCIPSLRCYRSVSCTVGKVSCHLLNEFNCGNSAAEKNHMVACLISVSLDIESVANYEI